jgi:hypothetical protein
MLKYYSYGKYGNYIASAYTNIVITDLLINKIL